MFRLKIILLLFLFSACLTAQEIDSLVYFEDLNFSSIFEEMVFSRLEEGQETHLEDIYLALSVASENEAARYKSQLRKLENSLKEKGIMEKKAKKQVKTIYEDVHGSLMVKYDNEAYLPDLFKNGKFNCVTGSMVYALIFAEFNIPYSIQKGMNHVNLVAYPETFTILVESTDAVEGTKSMTRADKQSYVDNLSRGKLISQDERTQSNMTSLFYQYAFEESQIDERELASYQYFNRGLFHTPNMDYELAFNDFEKAFYLKPGKELAGLMLQTGAVTIQMSDYRKQEHLDLLIKLSRYSKYGISEDMILAEFARITEKVFLDRNNLEAYNRAHETLVTKLKSEKLVKKISLMYFGTIVNDLLQEGKVNATLPYMEKMYALDPEDKQIQNLIQEVLVDRLSNSLISPPEQLAMLDQYRESMPMVYKMHFMQLIDLSVLLGNAVYWFDRGEPVKGSSFLVRFEEDHTAIEDLSRIHAEIESAYESAAYFCYERGYLRQTREYLDRGLKILPNSYALKRLKSSI